MFFFMLSYESVRRDGNALFIAYFITYSPSIKIEQCRHNQHYDYVVIYIYYHIKKINGK